MGMKCIIEVFEHSSLLGMLTPQESNCEVNATNMLINLVLKIQYHNLYFRSEWFSLPALTNKTFISNWQLTSLSLITPGGNEQSHLQKLAQSHTSQPVYRDPVFSELTGGCTSTLEFFASGHLFSSHSIPVF